MRVLVAEDDPDTGALITSVLEDRLAFSAEQVANGALVLDQHPASPPDLLILDVALPGLSGVDVFDVVRGDARWANVPILFLTAAPDRAERALALRGINAVMRKPFDVDALVAKVGELLSRARAV
jgi:DNA-binding response OmpR family regulator